MRITPRNGGQPVVAILGDGVAKVTRARGWEEVSRPKRRGFPDWKGAGLIHMAIPLLFDGWIDEEIVQGKVDRLERMAIPVSRGKAPPTVKVAGNVPHTDKVWVIEDIEYGELLRGSGGNLRRQYFTLMLMEDQASDVVKLSPAKRRREGKGGGKGRREVWVRTKPGNVAETLIDVAARELGDAARWQEIATANSIRDPRGLRPGQSLLLP